MQITYFTIAAAIAATTTAVSVQESQENPVQWCIDELNLLVFAARAECETLQGDDVAFEACVADCQNDTTMAPENCIAEFCDHHSTQGKIEDCLEAAVVYEMELAGHCDAQLKQYYWNQDLEMGREEIAQAKEDLKAEHKKEQQDLRQQFMDELNQQRSALREEQKGERKAQNEDHKKMLRAINESYELLDNEACIAQILKEAAEARFQCTKDLIANTAGGSSDPDLIEQTCQARYLTLMENLGQERGCPVPDDEPVTVQ